MLSNQKSSNNWNFQSLNVQRILTHVNVKNPTGSISFIGNKISGHEFVLLKCFTDRDQSGEDEIRERERERERYCILLGTASFQSLNVQRILTHVNVKNPTGSISFIGNKISGHEFVLLKEREVVLHWSSYSGNGGVVYSNKVIVIASMQTKAHLITELGHGMEPTLAIHKDKLLIAPYGFDKSVWDPSVDKFLPESYSEEDMKGKSVCKISLQKHLGLTKNASMILVGCMLTEVSDVYLENLKTLVWMASRKGIQFVFMLCSQNPGLRREVESLLLELKDGNVKFIDKYDEPLLHLILAGCDIILCPSLDDPVLQVPLKAIKYGAGLVALNFTDDKFGNFADHDFGRPEVSKYISNSFGNMSLSQAINEIEEDPSQWNRKITDAMAKDFSWDAECCDIHVSAYAAIKNL
ncbi:unnamed protein product [Coffea canephora]|uniref:starch synthase n=1 Tax=Coffea canephora TaxID=49390 RepID=A0A068U2A7_COFCA|nr:unnamed protein product [Coffea canephora]